MSVLVSNNTLKASGDYSELSKIREFIISKAELAGLNSKRVNGITLAVDEACSNIIRYGIKFKENEFFKVTVNFNKKEFVIKIIDHSTPFDPESSPSPNMEDYFKRFKKGGLGIHIIKQVVDKLDYTPSSKTNPNNVLTLTMKL